MLTLKHKIYAAVILIGLAVLAIDRMTGQAGGSGPAVARGAVQTQAAAPGATATTTTVTSPVGGGIPELPFPKGMPAFDPQSDTRDLFAEPRPAEPANSMPGQDMFAGMEEPAAVAVTAAAFAGGHELTATYESNQVRIAIINGRRMKVGDDLDGCLLIEITGRRALFRCLDGVVLLQAGGPTLVSAASGNSGSAP